MDDVLTDQLWRRLAALLPRRPRRGRYPGRRPVDDRAALAGTVCVRRTGVAWPDLPTTVGCSGVTCWRRPRDWQAVPARLLAELPAAGRLALPAALVDAAHRTRSKGGSRSAPQAGTPLAVTLTGGHRHDVTELLPLVGAVGPIRGRRGRPRRRPCDLLAAVVLRLRNRTYRRIRQAETADRDGIPDNYQDPAQPAADRTKT